MLLLERSIAPRTWLVRVPVLLLVVAACAASLLLGACGGITSTPDLTGLTLSEAQAIADDAGLQLVEGEKLPSFLPAGTVLAQEPLPGTVSSDSTITLTVSRDPIPVEVRKIDPKDPDGDGRENDAELPNLYDGDPNTSWSTETTYRTPDFQGLGNKIGVGFSFFLEEEATMLKVDYTLTGWEGEVQMISSEDMPIALAQLGQNRQVSWREPISEGRVWFTRLAPLPDSDRYGVVINEITFYR